MVFVTVSTNEEQITLLTDFLLTLTPGCTIHRNRDPVRAMRPLSHEKVDCLFADAEICSALMDSLNKREVKPSVYALCGKDAASGNLPEGIRGVVTYPITDHKIRDLLQV